MCKHTRMRLDYHDLLPMVFVRTHQETHIYLNTRSKKKESWIGVATDMKNALWGYPPGVLDVFFAVHKVHSGSTLPSAVVLLPRAGPSVGVLKCQTSPSVLETVCLTMVTRLACRGCLLVLATAVGCQAFFVAPCSLQASRPRATERQHKSRARAGLSMIIPPAE